MGEARSEATLGEELDEMAVIADTLVLSDALFI